VHPSRAGLIARLAAALLAAGFVLTTIADAAWAHGVGVACLLGFVAVAFPALVEG
jgi:hypothetical protein